MELVRNLDDTVNWTNIFYFSNNFIAINNAGEIRISSDAISWSEATNTNVMLSDIVSLGNRICIIGDYVTSISFNGSRFDKFTFFTLSNNTIEDVRIHCAYGNNRIVAFNSDDNYQRSTFSTDGGIYWEQNMSIDFDIHDVWLNITYDDDCFMIVGEFGNILLSNDGKTWQFKQNKLPQLGLGNCGLTCFGGSFIDAIGDVVLVSNDKGDTWKECPTDVGGPFNDVIVV